MNHDSSIVKFGTCWSYKCDTCECKGIVNNYGVAKSSIDHHKYTSMILDLSKKVDELSNMVMGRNLPGPVDTEITDVIDEGFEKSIILGMQIEIERQRKLRGEASRNADDRLRACRRDLEREIARQKRLRREEAVKASDRADNQSKELARLLDENAKLKEENKDYRRRLGLWVHND